MLLLERSLGLVGHFEKLVVKLIELLEHPLGGNPDSVFSIARADQSEGELFQVHAEGRISGTDLLPVIQGSHRSG